MIRPSRQLRWMRAAATLAALAIAMTTGCGGLLKSASEGIAKKTCENFGQTSGAAGDCVAGATTGGATTAAAVEAAEPPMDTSDLPGDWPAYLVPKTGTVKLVNAGPTSTSVIFHTRTIARDLGNQAKAAGCTTHTSTGISVSDHSVRLECGDMKVTLMSGVGDLIIGRSPK